MVLADGFYSQAYRDGQYRTIKVETFTEGKLAKKTVLSIQVNEKWTGIAFLEAKNYLVFWRKFRDSNPPMRLLRIQEAVLNIARQPDKAQLAYAIKENRCARCGQVLTVSPNLNGGLGSECAGRARWRKGKKQAVFEGIRDSE